MAHYKCKYTKMLTPEQLGFLEYYMLPEKDEFQYVYRPGDDSFLMLSVLKKQLQGFPQHPIICEVGSGSGILSAHLHKWLKQTNNEAFFHFATDINLDACILSQKYYDQYNLNVQQICTSLLKACRIEPQIIVCNPPYVLTDAQQKQHQKKYLTQKLQNIRQKRQAKRSPNTNLIAYSYMGGPEGLDTTRQLISYISWETKLYIIVMGEQGVQTLRQQVESGKIIQKGLKASYEILQFAKKVNEELFVILINFKNV